MSIKRIQGDAAVTGFESYADTPHGRLRYDLLFHYYFNIIREFNRQHFIDIGGGNGILSERLLRHFPDLKVSFVDDDQMMLKRAAELLREYIDNGRVRLLQASVFEKDKLEPVMHQNEGKVLLGFNHVIEYIRDKSGAIAQLFQYAIPGSIVGIMYLNNSHEALRRLLFKDELKDVLEQINHKIVNMGHFGVAEAIDSEWLDRQLRIYQAKEICQYGLRCVSDLKSPEFVENNYSEVLGLEKELGAKPDYMGLARYRLHFIRAI